MGDEVEFLPADKHKIFYKVVIFLGVISQTGPKYQKQSVDNIFAISQGKHEAWSMSKLPKITSLLFLYNMLRKKWVMQLIFYMQISMKACYKLILRFFDGYGQAFPKFPKKQVCNVFTISLKKKEAKWLILSNTLMLNSLEFHFFPVFTFCIFLLISMHAI